MITFLFVFLAAAFKATTDVLDHQRSSSIFKNLPLWWSNNFEHRYRAPWPLDFLWTHFSDAWHLCNSAMISMFLFATFTYQLPEYFTHHYIMFILCWIIWGASFEFFTAVFKNN